MAIPGLTDEWWGPYGTQKALTLLINETYCTVKRCGQDMADVQILKNTKYQQDYLLTVQEEVLAIMV